MKISLIIAAYNEERYIASCLDSLLAQSIPCEIIVVDDGSTDSTRRIVRKYKQVRLVKQKHSGLGVSRNRGATEARGADILVFADADMEYDPRYVERLVSPIISGKAIGTTHIDERVANAENIWSQCWSINADLAPGERTSAKLPKSGKLNIFRAILAREFKKVGGFDPVAGYFDDKTLGKRLGGGGLIVKGAVAYHNNPEALKEVFESARWIGRSNRFKPNMLNVARYTPINSLRNGLRKVLRGAPWQYILFKLTFDAGMLAGIFNKKDGEK